MSYYEQFHRTDARYSSTSQMETIRTTSTPLIQSHRNRVSLNQRQSGVSLKLILLGKSVFCN